LHLIPKRTKYEGEGLVAGEERTRKIIRQNGEYGLGEIETRES